MADKEYGTRFKIVQLYNGGLRIITNELSLDILRAVMRKQSNLTEISKIVNSSKTTVQANISSMEADGLLVSCPDPNDNRSIIYGSNCMPILSSGSSGRLLQNSGVEAMRSIREIENNPHRNAMIFFSNELCNHNICIHPMLLDIGSSMGSVLFKSFDHSNESLVSFLAKTFKIPDSYFKGVILDNNLSIRLSNSRDTVASLSYLGFVVMGILMYYRYKTDGSIYSREVRIIKVSDCEIILESPKLFVNNIVNEMTPVEKRDWNFFRPINNYSIYHPDGAIPLAITNPTMIEILDQLEVSDHTVNSLSTRLGLKTITVHASLVKMVKLGLVKQVDPNEVRNIRYCLSSHSVLVAKESNVQFVSGTIQEHLDRFLLGEKDLFETIYNIQFFIYACGGIRHDFLMGEIGNATSRDFLLNNPGMSAEQFLRATLSLFIDKAHKLELVSILPIHYRLECSDEQGIIYLDSKMYLEAMVKSGLKQITGIDYPVLIESVVKRSE